MRRRGRRKVFHAKEELNRCLLPCAKRVASKRHVAGRLGAIEDVYGGLCLWVCCPCQRLGAGARRLCCARQEHV